MSLPTFVIVGAQKCGTSTLHRMLRDHPQVFMSRPKELHFFDRHWDRGLGWYAEQFTPGPRQVHAGESTPIYLYDTTSRQRLIDSLPEARMVAILRDPAKRAYSHYWHSRRLGRDQVPTFEEAIDLEASRLASDDKDGRARHSYVDRGHYLEQLRVFEAAYGRNRLHVLLLEDLTEQRVRSLEDLFTFLDIAVEPAATIQPRWANPYRLNLGKTKPEPASYPPLSPDTHHRLAEHFRPHNEALAAWLGRDLSHWG